MGAKDVSSASYDNKSVAAGPSLIICKITPWYRLTIEDLEGRMLAIFGAISIGGSTYLACATTDTRFEKEMDVVSGLLLVAGLSMFGILMSACH